MSACVGVCTCARALVWAEMANECEGKQRECRKSAAGGTSTCSIEIMTCSHIPLPRRLSASTYGPVGKQCDTGPLANQTSLIPPLWSFLSPRLLSLKLHLAQNYLIKELSPRPPPPLLPPPPCHPSFSTPAWRNTFWCLLIASASHRLWQGPVVFTPRHCNLSISPSCASASYLGALIEALW